MPPMKAMKMIRKSMSVQHTALFVGPPSVESGAGD